MAALQKPRQELSRGEHGTAVSEQQAPGTHHIRANTETPTVRIVSKILEICGLMSHHLIQIILLPPTAACTHSLDVLGTGALWLCRIS